MKLRKFAWTLAGSVAVAAIVSGVAIKVHARSVSESLTEKIVAPPRVVAVYPVERRNVTNNVSLVAELRPYVSTNLYAKVSGYLKSIAVDYGSRVYAGETIATLELPEQEADYEQAEAAYKLAKVDYDRILSVVHAQPGLLAQEDVDKAQATYEEAKDARDRAAVLLGYANITAPFDGVVTKRYVDPGALIQQGTASSTQAQPIVQVSDNYNLRLVVETPESMVEKIHVGTPVEVKIQSTGQAIQGNVARFSYDLHEATRTMHTEIDVPNPGLALKPGMYASADIDLATHRGVLTIPTQALAEGSTPNVWVVDSHDQIEQRNVAVGLQTPNWVEVTSGLKLGDRVLIGDRSSMTTGMTVEPKVVASIDR